MESSSPPEWLNYHHLRYFWTVAREGSLRAAAEKLHVSQSSICAQIQLLEAALGEDLFRLNARSLVLTEFGHMILGYAERSSVWAANCSMPASNSRACGPCGCRSGSWTPSPN